MGKLNDAILAETVMSSECALILAKGEIAKRLAVSGLSVVRLDTCGVYPSSLWSGRLVW